MRPDSLLWQVWHVKEQEAAKVATIQDAGHQSGIRAAALSTDDTMLLTVAAEGIKVILWGYEVR